ncbi:antibiotic biosynthesis monooxygenase family protein [Thermasporomyces composti]|jgi:heme-degrading monooxygenase HmoA|uniref:Heme-degrading monooxygenase HmoA n=1 Tax=Thermasporomyces composti TaxID=696763 RepID=A0A3D9VGN5_THECX|nr:antibiotic biosynthesis monooxygenase [Thermasporomyces composti]REF38315.1 heme-degrading monooxygenase HmoA [Thermasporomyces composti]
MAPVYRVDRFVVPADARDEFWKNVRRTHEVLRRQPGFVEDALLENRLDEDRYDIVTIARWASADDLANAKAAVERSHQEAQFSPPEFFRRAGIEADLGTYVRVDE